MRGGYRQPPLRAHLHAWFCNVFDLNPHPRYRMTYSRSRILVRIVATLTGDIAVGTALASACLWLIQSAALGLFLSFIAWLLAFFASLALSQYLVHPVVHVVLSDRKLNLAVQAVQQAGSTLQHRFARLNPWRTA